MTPRCLRFALALLPALAVAAAALDSPAEVERAVAISELRAGDGAIHVRLANKTTHTLRDVRLLLEYVYQWPRETRPGDVSPGAAWVHVVPGPIAPGTAQAVDFRPPGGLPTGPGSFEPRASVLGFTEQGAD